MLRRYPINLARRQYSSQKVSPFKKQSLANRDLILSILSLTTTRRETNTYLNKYRAALPIPWSKASKSSPQSSLPPATVRCKEEGVEGPQPTVKRLILIKIRGNLHNHNQSHLKSLRSTISYLMQLGNTPLILLDSSELINKSHQSNTGLNHKNIEQYLNDQFNVLSKLWNDNHHPNNDIDIKNLNGFGEMNHSMDQVDAEIEDPIQVMPIKSALSYNDEAISFDLKDLILKTANGSMDLASEGNSLQSSKRIVNVFFPYIYDSVNAMNLLCDTGDFMGYLTNELLRLNHIKSNGQEDVLSIEKVLFIDELGGIPSVERLNNSHVFINLNQEYDQIQAELQIGYLSLPHRDIHLKNLQTMNSLLDSSPSTTGIITTLEIAIQTMKLNPIIYNVLTDRALVSSSLSTNKISDNAIHQRITKTTILKKGLKISVFHSLDSLDLDKFKSLIDDSFKKSLNLDHYIKRIKSNINTIITVGDYDGIAVITNEKSPSTGLTFPYLDKFAISREAQGSLGVADIIFNIILKQIARNNVIVWRSRKGNPVNGWYFQRSNGSFDLVDSQFRLFWNNGGRTARKFSDEEFKTFVEIASSIEPSFDK